MKPGPTVGYDVQPDSQRMAGHYHLPPAILGSHQPPDVSGALSDDPGRVRFDLENDFLQWGACILQEPLTVPGGD